MTSFLPLIEAFLALGLTMIVLTTGVSSLSGAWQRACRARARGLRALLRCLFLLALRDKLAEARAGVSADDDALYRFVGEMSFQPGKLAEIAASANPIAAYRRALPELQPEAAASSDDTPFRLWSSLADTLDTLSDDEFKTRFKASTLGKALAAADAAGFDAMLADIHAKFVAYGHAATEEYARNARQHSIVFAAVLAFGANIDAFNLLETYLAQPTLRAAIIEKYEKIGNGQPAAANPPASKVDTTPTDKIDQLAALATTLAPEQKQQIDEKAKAAKDAVVVASKTVLDESRQIINEATTSFPVGWDRYPGCLNRSSDSRCAGLKVSATAWDGFKEAYGNDTSRLTRWFAGLVLTIAMLGLGAPFWIETVNGLLRARDLVRGGNNAGDGSKTKPASGSQTA